MRCEYCHPHCTRTEHGSDCVLCDCRKTRPIKRRALRLELGNRYMLRQGRLVPGFRRVTSGEIVTLRGLPDGEAIVETYDGILVQGVGRNELGRHK